jgi:hypothetical protein
MPEFHANVAAHEAWKAQVMAGEIVLEELDTAPFATIPAELTRV